MNSKNQSSICEVVKKKKFLLVFLSHLKLQKLHPWCVLSASLDEKGIKLVGEANEQKMCSH